MEGDDEEESSEIHKLWDAQDDEFLIFRNIPVDQRPCSSSDLCAFVYLDRLFPDEKNRNMISAAGHDQIWLRITEEQIATLTEVDVLYLTRCGVFHEEEFAALSMFA